jgi:hypothetical protein
MAYLAQTPRSASAALRRSNFIPGWHSSRMRSPYGSSSRRERMITVGDIAAESMLRVVGCSRGAESMTEER